MRNFTRELIRGAVCGIFAVAVFGFFAHVRAVPPGATADPDFGPQNDDVDVQFRLDCREIIGGVDAFCPPGYTLTGGGGLCLENNSYGADIYPVNLTWWQTTCTDSNDEQSRAICCRITT